MKKVLSICLLAALLLCCFAGCDVDPEKEILGFWTGNPEMVDGVPLGSDMIIEFRNNGTGIRYVQIGNTEYETPFTYTIADGRIDITIYEKTSVSLKLEFKDGKMFLTDESLNATEEYLRLESKEDKIKQES